MENRVIGTVKNDAALYYFFDKKERGNG